MACFSWSYHQSVITGQSIHLRHADAVVAAHKDKPKIESTPKSHQNSTTPWGPPPPPQIFNVSIRRYKISTFNDSNGDSSRPSHKSTTHQHSAPRPTESPHHAPPHRSTSSNPTASVPATANHAIEAYSKMHRSRSSKDKAVRFTESVSAREREQKQWHPNGPHRTNYESKSGQRPKASNIERLMCESCQMKSQRYLDGESGKRFCDGCYRFKEGRRAGRR